MSTKLGHQYQHVKELGAGQARQYAPVESGLERS